MSGEPMAAAAIFDRPGRGVRKPHIVDRDRALLNALNGLTGEFTILDLAKKVHPCPSPRYCELGAFAARLLQELCREGHVVLVRKPHKLPFFYRWADELPEAGQ